MLKGMAILLMLNTLSCLTKPNEEPVVTPSKFGEKFKNLHQTIVITKPGVYDYKGTMHIWKGGGGCSIFGAAYPVMEINADNVTIRNFGFKEATTGIVVSAKVGKEPRSNVSIENVEGRSCQKPLSLPATSQNVSVKDSIFVVTE